MNHNKTEMNVLWLKILKITSFQPPEHLVNETKILRIYDMRYRDDNILFIFERFLTCKYCKYTSGSYRVSTCSLNFYLLLHCY